MYSDKIVLCGASAYEQKYYFNQDFDALPQQVKDELQIICVMYTEEIGGVFTMEFDEDILHLPDIDSDVTIPTSICNTVDRTGGETRRTRQVKW